MSVRFNLTLPRRDFMIKLSGEFGKGFTGITGPSGAGKTSLFALFAGLELPLSGSISLNGRTLTDCSLNIHIPVHKRRVAVVFQDRQLFPHMTVRENIQFAMPYAARLLSINRRLSFDRVVEMMKLETLLDSYPHEISGGEQRRTAIGRSLMASPELLLLDEPFNGLDQDLRETILLCLKKSVEEYHIPTLLISHDMEDLKALTKHIYSIDRGQRSCPHNRNLQDSQVELSTPHKPSFPYSAP